MTASGESGAGDDGEETSDPYVGKTVKMVRGKYIGRSAFVQRKVKKKWRLQVTAAITRAFA